MFICRSDLSLDINFSHLLGYPCSINIRPWNEGISWSSYSEGTQTEYKFIEQLPVPFLLIRNEKGAAPWLNTIPKQIQSTLARYEQTYKNISFPTLWLISRNKYAYEYFLNQPKILWLILETAKQNHWNESLVFQLFSQKRKYILAACNLPPRKSTLNLISKLSFRFYGTKQYRTLIHVLSNSEYVKLSHMSTIDDHVLEFTTKFPELLKSRLLSHIRENWNWPELRKTVIDIKRMACMLNIDDVFQRIGRCRDLAEVRRLHDHLTEIINAQELKSLPDIPYPAPPLDGTQLIAPITCMRELAIEAKEQRHCVLSYHERILCKQYYVYKILSPERATLGIRITSDKHWTIDQLKLKCNQSPSVLTQQTAYKWLSEANAIPQYGLSYDDNQ
ncbi:MAG: hypothetical protein C4575_14155 [Desulforudis sp.]|jgi:hypothetical protein|nr:MAG: hypothetical protein C4575_14155 [Desulforudis sp.]